MVYGWFVSPLPLRCHKGTDTPSWGRDKPDTGFNGASSGEWGDGHHVHDTACKSQLWIGDVLPGRYKPPLNNLMLDNLQVYPRKESNIAADSTYS